MRNRFRTLSAPVCFTFSIPLWVLFPPFSAPSLRVFGPILHRISKQSVHRAKIHPKNAASRRRKARFLSPFSHTKKRPKTKLRHRTKAPKKQITAPQKSRKIRSIRHPKSHRKNTKNGLKNRRKILPKPSVKPPQNAKISLANAPKTAQKGSKNRPKNTPKSRFDHPRPPYRHALKSPQKKQKSAAAKAPQPSPKPRSEALKSSHRTPEPAGRAEKCAKRAKKRLKRLGTGQKTHRKTR